MRKDRTIAALVAGGFLMLAIEVRYLHRDAIGEHWQAWIPVLYGLAAFAAGAAFLFSPRARSIVAAVFATGIAVGLFGFFQHTEGSPAEIGKLFTLTVIARADDESGEQRTEKTKDESEPPALAPLGIAGLAAIGFVAVSRGSSPNAAGL